jgi:hypothetical protein
MTNNYDTQDVLDDFLMTKNHQAVRGKVWIYLEGEYDKELFGNVFNEQTVTIEPLGGVVSVKDVVAQLLSKNFENVIGIIDADFTRLSNIQNHEPNIFMTDNHDVEMMLIQNDYLFKKITLPYLASDKREHFDYTHLRGQLLESLFWFSLVRFYNYNHELGLFLKDFPIHVYVGINVHENISFEFNKRECLQLVNQRSKNKKREVNENEIDQISTETFDLWNLCNGHDFLKVWANSLNTLTKLNINDEKLRHDLYLVFDLNVFKETHLYALLKEWEEHSHWHIFLSCT